jgi:7,8-dihydropterin-6-yl-methyl-4-(beta-D-ribofuranosyl)aminobenzene 5'-phosphate synthase
MKPLLTVIVAILLWSDLLFAQADITRIITLCDNYQVNSQTRTDWGFSCLVIHGNDTILFDAGNRVDLFNRNLSVLGIDAKTVNAMVISHHHGDHTGNVFNVLEMNRGIKVYLPTSLEGEFEARVNDSGGKACVKSDCKRIAKDIYLSGEMGFQIKEQALVIDTKKGLVIIVGCGHPGIDRMVAKIKDHFHKDVFLVLGGFHTLEANQEEAYRMIERFRQMQVKKVAPSHCTGKLTKELFKETYQSNFIENGIGKIIEI